MTHDLTMQDKAALRKDIEELQELQQRGTGDATSMKEKIHELCSVNESLAMDKAVLEDDRNRLALRMQVCLLYDTSVR